MNHLFSTKKPREIKLKFKGETITPRQVFQIFYQGLEPLIKANIKAVQKKDIRRSPTSRKYSDSKLEEEARELHRKWLKEFPEEEASAEVIFDDKTRMNYSLKKRTNFDLTLVAPPSIIYMQDAADESRAVLREARTYNPREWVSKLGCRRFGKLFDIPASEQFYFDDKEELKVPEDKRSVIYIPEPHLLLALEDLYQLHFPRITPEIHVIDAEDKTLWYIRRLLPTLVNSEFDFRKLARYYGASHALGLMEMLDRQVVHYCSLRNRVVNYDPDVITHTRKITILAQKDITDLMENLDWDSEKYNLHVYPENKKEFRGISEDARTRLGEAGFNQETIFGKLRKKIEKDKVKKVVLASS